MTEQNKQVNSKDKNNFAQTAKPQSNSAVETITRGARAKWWQRRGSKKRGFYYLDKDGKRITDEAQIERINALVIPPAWQHVRIAPGARSNLQAIGMDTAGRVQYIYHASHTARQQRKKFAKITRFGAQLPALRQATNTHIELEGFPREKVLAVVIRLINELYIRVGSEDSVKRYRTYGVTTLRNRHLTIGRGGRLTFSFVGKHHIKHRRVLVDKELADLLRDLKKLGGAKLFHYYNGEGKPQPVKPQDVNNYIKANTAPEFSAKDFRTWGGTLLAAVTLAELGAPDCDTDCKHNILKAVRAVAERLGNTPAVCRGSYIHPGILETYEKGITLEEFRRKLERRIRRIEHEATPEELALLKLLQE